MTDRSSRAQELVSMFRELPFHEGTSPTTLQTDFPRVSPPPRTESERDSDNPDSSSEHSPSQSRRYVRGGLDVSFAAYHAKLASAQPPTRGDADIPHISSDSPSQSRQGTHAKLQMSSVADHEKLTLNTDTEAAVLESIPTTEKSLIDRTTRQILPGDVRQLTHPLPPTSGPQAAAKAPRRTQTSGGETEMHP